MRKFTFSILTLMAFMLVGFTSQAQVSTLYQDDFESYTVGDHIAQTIPNWWTTWSNAPGGAEDGVFSDEITGTKSAKLAYGNDQVLLLGDKETGVYNLEFDIYIPTGYNGYFNVLHDFNGSNSTWALQAYFHETNDGQNSTAAPGQGTLHAGGNAVATLTCVYDEWMHVKVHVDTDNDVAEFWLDGQLVHTWQWSLDSFGENTVGRKLSAMNFFPPENTATSLYYIDNVVFNQEGGNQELIGDSFEEYTVGNKVAQEAISAGNDWWTTWSNAPGGNEDAVVSDAFASEGSNSMYIGTSSNDMVLLFGDKETGLYDIEFDMYFEQGKTGYFNLLHNFAGSNSTWAMQAYFHLNNDGTNTTEDPGHGMIHAGGNNVAQFDCVYDQWMTIKVTVDADNDLATMYVDGVEIYSWQWSLDSFGENTVGRTLAAMDIFAAATSSQFYIDNIHFTQVGGESAPDMSVNVASFNFEMLADETASETFTINNNGNSIGDWIAWVDFGEGQGGTQETDINYDGENASAIGFTTGTPLVEVGAMYPAASYGGAVMGTYITKARYFVYSDQLTGQAGFSGGLTFRIYRQGLYDAPGEILAEKVIAESNIVVGAWNEVTFDTPVALTGFNVWATVEYTQIEGAFPIAMDGLTVIPYGDMYRINSGGWSSLNEGASEIYGNHNIRITCTGNPILGSWASLGTGFGSIMGGNSADVDLNVNSIALPNGTYNANVMIITNDENNAQIVLPLTLNVGPVSTPEIEAGSYTIYPNPTKGMITLDANSEITKVTIYNNMGQVVYNSELNSLRTNIDLDFGAGMYFVTVVTTEGTSTQKIVVE